MERVVPFGQKEDKKERKKSVWLEKTNKRELEMRLVAEATASYPRLRRRMAFTQREKRNC